MSAIAREIDQIIQKVAAAPRTPRPPDPDLTGRAQEIDSLLRDNTMLHPGLYRDLVGDYTLFARGNNEHQWQKIEGSVPSKIDQFLVFCLWKLVDANAELSKASSTDFEMHMGGAYVGEAMWALQHAQSLHQSMQFISEQNRRNDILANPHAEANRLRALEMAEEKPIRSKNMAAEHIAQYLVKGIDEAGQGTTYTTEWIKAWLREAAWISLR